MAWKRQPAAAGVDGAALTPAHTASWTHGSVLSSRIWGGVLGAAILCGPLALGAFTLQALTPAPAPIASKTTPGFSRAQQDAGAYALAYVTAWMGATTNDSTALAAFTNVSSATFPQNPMQYRDTAVASISDPSNGIVSVVIGAAVAPSANAEAVWPRRYYTVTVGTSNDPHLTVIGLPSPSTGPSASSSTVTLDYPANLATTTGVGQTVTSFLQAYLTGQGDITVVLSPGTTIKPIRPTAYRQVQISSILATANVPTKPSDGTTLRTLVQAQLTTAGNEQEPVTYLLRLTARAGRWEISSLDLYPALSQ